VISRCLMNVIGDVRIFVHHMPVCILEQHRQYRMSDERLQARYQRTISIHISCLVLDLLFGDRYVLCNCSTYCDLMCVFELVHVLLKTTLATFTTPIVVSICTTIQQALVRTRIDLHNNVIEGMSHVNTRLSGMHDSYFDKLRFDVRNRMFALLPCRWQLVYAINASKLFMNVLQHVCDYGLGCFMSSTNIQ
jgi:hypothetical protein